MKYIIFLIAILGCGCYYPRRPACIEPRMQPQIHYPNNPLWDGNRYEYNVITLDDVCDFNQVLNHLGNNGWELITSRRITLDRSTDDFGYEFIFKRPMRQ